MTDDDFDNTWSFIETNLLLFLYYAFRDNLLSLDWVWTNSLFIISSDSIFLFYSQFSQTVGYYNILL